MPTVTIDEQGRLVVPRALRDRLGLSHGTAQQLHLWETGDGVMIEAEPRPSRVEEGPDGLPVLQLDGVGPIGNEEVLAAIHRSRDAR